MLPANKVGQEEEKLVRKKIFKVIIANSPRFLLVFPFKKSLLYIPMGKTYFQSRFNYFHSFEQVIIELSILVLGLSSFKQCVNFVAVT